MAFQICKGVTFIFCRPLCCVVCVHNTTAHRVVSTHTHITFSFFPFSFFAFDVLRSLRTYCTVLTASPTGKALSHTFVAVVDWLQILLRPKSTTEFKKYSNRTNNKRFTVCITCLNWPRQCRRRCCWRTTLSMTMALF